MKMRKLNLPIIKGGIPPPKYLSMDDYLRFVTLNLKYTARDKGPDRDRKKRPAAGVAFSFKE